MKRTSKAQKVKAGMLLATMAAAAGALTAVMILQKRKEEVVYHEAELKAMDELEAFMREEDCDCDGVEESAASNLMHEDAAPDYDDSARKEYAQAHLEEMDDLEEDAQADAEIEDDEE